MHDRVLGLDIGGTKLAAGVISHDGDVLSFATAPTPSNADAGLRSLVELGHRAIHAAGAPAPSLVGIGSCGPLDPATGVLTNPINLDGWRDVAVRDVVAQALNLPTVLNNDATAAAAGEWLFGAGQGMANVLYLTISTGIGGGVVAGGRLFLGTSGNGGELGHLIVVRNGRKCMCPQSGCLEAHCSGSAIAQIARERVAGGRTSVLASLESITAASVAAAAKAGDDLAVKVWDEAMTILAEGITSLANIFEPQVIVLGGGVTGAGDQLLAPIRDRVRTHAITAEKYLPKIVLSDAGPHVGVVGAAAAAIHLAETAG